MDTSAFDLFISFTTGGADTKELTAIDLSLPVTRVLLITCIMGLLEK